MTSLTMEHGPMQTLKSLSKVKSGTIYIEEPKTVDQPCLEMTPMHGCDPTACV